MATSAGTVVVIDDEEPICNYLADVLRHEGYECKCFRESLAALAYLSHAEIPPDLVMTDLLLPGLDGLDVVKQVHALSPDLPVVLISGAYELGVALEAVQSGAADYLFKPAQASDVVSMVAKHVHAGPKAPGALQAALVSFASRYNSYADQDPRWEEEPDQHSELFQVLSAKRYETMQHSLRVASYAVLLGRSCGMSRNQLRQLRLGAVLHDIGKIAIPRNILSKPAPLDPREWDVMHTHPRIGFLLLSAVPGMEEAARIVYTHHERWDGKGYPRGLRGQEIPLGSRLFSIVDTVDAITCDRPYRPARGFQTACREIQTHSASQFDPALVELFLALPKEELLAIRSQLQDTN